MRNWNMLLQALSHQLSECFYSTYEELKHFWIENIGKSEESFYSTYEELKRVLWHVF